MQDWSRLKSARNLIYLCAGCTALLLFSPLGASQSGQSQAAGSTSEFSTLDAPATFRSRVNLVMIPVVVRDSQGQANRHAKNKKISSYSRKESRNSFLHSRLRS